MNIGESILFIKEGVKEWEGTKTQVISSGNSALQDFLFASDLIRKASEIRK
jgi:phospholipid/cholesterol/gamma-HCH transport system ATP-binding protein